MRLISVDTSEKNTAVLEIEIDKERFAETVTKIFRSKASSLTVPGFRKGKAPRSIIEKMYGKGVFYEEALNELLPEAVDEALDESKISPVSKPEIDVKSMDENGVFVTAKYTVKPEVEIKNYKGLEAKRSIIAVSEEEIDADIAKTQKRNARSLEITDRAAQLGDEVQIDYEGFADGVPFEGGKGEDHKLKLGAGEFIPGFEEQIVGKNIDEEFDVNVTFPEDYHSEELKGKPATFKVKLNSIRYEELPELDDEFAMDVSEFDTFELYRDSIRGKIKESHDKRTEYSLEQQLVDGLVAEFEADIPQVMIDDEIERQIGDYAYRIQSQGLDFETFMQYTGATRESMRAQFKEGAEKQIKTSLALEKVAQIEDLKATKEEQDEEYARLAEMYKLELAEVIERVDKNAIKNEIEAKKAVEFIKANANITEVETSLEEFEKELHKNHGHDHGDHDHDDDDDIDFDDDDIDFDEDEDE
ncbi:MAG: trigger factor [Oscillospiraceae bacterium]|nr:trigger factor [Oscillospiraceae bacterium]